MIAVIQRVLNANLKVDGQLISEIEKGFVVYLGVAKGDEKADADFLAKKITSLRIFEDENGKINLSIKDVGGEILLVSQFTLLANARHGNRPDFLGAESPDKANEMYEYALNKFNENGVVTKRGVFGADMHIIQYNQGPFTIILDTEKE